VDEISSQYRLIIHHIRNDSIRFSKASGESSENVLWLCFAFATASLSYDRLMSASLGEIACLVRKSIARVTPDYVHGSLKTLETLRRRRGLSTIEDIEVRHPQSGLVVTNLARLPLSSIDFGWGPLVGFKASAQTHRSVVILPSDDGVTIRAFPP